MNKVEVICSRCGAENEPTSRFCRNCGAAIATRPPSPAGARKIVTVLFSDVAGSTVLGEELDPETFRQLMTRYYDEMSTVIERHGGTTEKFIGDAIMAVFGIPQLHEDDAVRAVRTAVEMRQELGDLNDEFQRNWGVTIDTRMGVNSGEVATGDPSAGESFVAGDTVNVGKRLEQSAGSGEILIGESTYRLVRYAATAERVDPLTVKGKAQPIAAWRLVDVAPGEPGLARRLDSALVGREEELATLRKLYERVVDTRSCELVTLLGAAGVGKSRLTHEFLSGVSEDTTVLRGRCLPYGEGITFWPIVEVLRDAAGIRQLDSPDEARPKVRSLLQPGGDSDLIADRLDALLGLSPVTPGIQETFWAVRKLFEELAARGPLVVLFDDVHWGESTFLDLLEYLGDWIRDVPVILLCLARPELLELRGEWMTGKANASLITLQPLREKQIEGLIKNLLRGAVVESALVRVAEVAEGNPLFVEETLRMLVDDGLLQPSNGSWRVAGDLSGLTIPPTIQTLLSARLERLGEEERAVIERASVIGRVFWWGAVSELAPEELRPRVGSHLQSLIRKELIRPDLSELRGEDAFRFTHILVRDAAYQGIPKATRADLHERFADWIVDRSQDRAGEYEEIVGYHLEQAHRALSDLGPATEDLQALGRRAAAPLASAGRRAYARGDMPAAVNLLSRAAKLGPREDPARLELLPELAFAHLETGDFAGLQETVAETGEAATRSGDPGLQADALILGLWVRLFTDPEGWAEEAHREATRAISMFEGEGDEHGLGRAWSLLGLVHLLKTEFADSEEAWEKAAAHAHVAGDFREELEYLAWVPLCVWGGPSPVEESIHRCQAVLKRAEGDRKAMSTALFTRGKLEAMRGRFDEGRELVAVARSILEEVSLTVWMAGPLTQMTGWVELLAGDPASAETHLRWGVTQLQEIGEQSWLSTTAAVLAEAIYAQGRHQEAEEFIRVSEEAAASEDVYSQGLLRTVRAKVMCHQGQDAEAERMSREAIALTEPTDFLFLRSLALLSLAEVYQVAGRPDEAEEPLRQAIRVSEEKGYVVGAGRARRLLESPAGRRG
jgi:class 3 adenylate cyclase/tetratricopeptide (TPR) repeat protein